MLVVNEKEISATKGRVNRFPNNMIFCPLRFWRWALHQRQRNERAELGTVNGGHGEGESAIEQQRCRTKI